MKIYITGIGGFLGGAMAADLRAAGHQVEGSRRDTPFLPSRFLGVDVFIHAAYDFRPGANNIGLTASRYFAARNAGIPRQIFLSSCSAGPESDYGRVKQKLEPLFLESQQCVVRPGLVMGEGGLFAQQRRAILRSPIVPMIGGGHQPTAVISLDEFLGAIRQILAEDLRGAYTLYRDPMPTYRDLVTNIMRQAGQTPRFFNVPIGLALRVTSAFERLHLPFPIAPGQIRVLTAGPRYPSDLENV